MKRKLARKILRLIFGVIGVIAVSPSHELLAASGITYQGRLIDPQGLPVVSSNVQFKLEIRTPGTEDCLLYEEIQNVDMTGSNGTFAISLADGTGFRQDSYGWTLFEAFSNRKSFNALTHCSGGNSFAPNPTDNRKFRVYFNDGTFAPGTWEALPTQSINYIPMAIESYSVGGYPASSLLRVETGGVLGVPAPLTGSQLTELLALIGGSSTQYSSPNELNGSALPSFNSGQSVRWTGSAWEAYTPITSSISLPTCTTGQVLTSNGTSLSCVTDAAGSSGIGPSDDVITTGHISGSNISGSTLASRDLRIYEVTNTNSVSILAPAGLSPSYTLTLPLNDGASGEVLTTNGSGVLSWETPALGIPSLSAGNILVGNGSGVATGVAVTGDLSLSSAGAATVTRVQGRSFASTAPALGSILRFNSLNQWEKFDCASGQVLKFGSASGWDCATDDAGTAGVTSVGLSLPGIFSVSNSPVTSTGSLTATLSNQTANSVFAGPSSGGAAAPGFRALQAADIPNLAAGKITSGTFAAARLGSGSASSSTYLRGDGTWAAISASTSAGGSNGQIQFNNGGSLAGTSNLVWDDVNSRIGIGTSIPTASIHLHESSGARAPIIRMSGSGGTLASTAFVYPTSYEEVGSGGGWASQSSIYAEDGAFARGTPGSWGTATSYLVAKGFGTSVPAGAAVVGIEVQFLHKANIWFRITDSIVIVKNSAILSPAKTTGVTWGDAAFTVGTVGGPSDNWGVSLTGADVNAADFGIGFSLTGLSAVGHIDAVKVKIHYLDPSGVPNWAIGSDSTVSGSFRISNGPNLSTTSDFVIASGGKVGIGTAAPAERLDVWGNIAVSGVTVHSSDARLKENIRPMKDALRKITSLNGYNYHWKNKSIDAGLQSGVLAQEVNEVFPELVSRNPSSGYLAVNYEGLIPALIESTKEINLRCEAEVRRIEELENKLRSLEERLEALERNAR